MLLVRILPAILLASCAGSKVHRTPTVLVDVSAKTLYVDGTKYTSATARRGTGNVPGSKKTPLGTFRVVNKWAPGDPTYHGAIAGPKLHLAGDNLPASRCIYVHKGKTSGNYSLGCVHLAPQDMAEVFSKVPIGAQVVIQP